MKMRPTLRLILGDQLNPLHSWFDQSNDQVIYVLMEVRSETDYVLHHAQKVLGIFAAMRAFSDRLKSTGHRVRYIRIDHPSNRNQITSNLDALIDHYDAKSVEYQEPDEWRLDKNIKDWASNCRVPVKMVDSEHYFTQRDDALKLFGIKKSWLMETFYRHQRRTHHVLIAPDSKPEGGQWNFDVENRKSWPGTPAGPIDFRPNHDHSALWQTIVEAGIKTMGNPQADNFRWPVDRDEALKQLEYFIDHVLPYFGDYQDAISRHHWHLFHSLLSFALNTKMLNPREVVLRAEQAWRDGLAPIHACEGFIRQILGWREYVRGIYWARMPDYTKSNELEHHHPLPTWFWTGKTDMACLADAIGQSLEHAYAHHIQRLMVIGNFSLLAGLDPTELHHWYLGIYIDAFEWVEAPNTIGMSQWADGGRLATKPYVSSAAYIQRMSDHCKGCQFNPKTRTEENSCPFNALYWNFFDRHRTRFENNHRLKMVYHQLDRMPEETLAEINSKAKRTLEKIL